MDVIQPKDELPQKKEKSKSKFLYPIFEEKSCVRSSSEISNIHAPVQQVDENSFKMPSLIDEDVDKYRSPISSSRISSVMNSPRKLLPIE